MNNMNSQDWYQALRKPSWAPDPSVFGQVWTPLYIIIAAVNVVILRAVLQGNLSLGRAAPFWINLFANVIFSPIQFGLRNNTLALVDILVVLTTIVWSMFAIWSYNKWIAFALLPYLVWVSIATVLQVQITYLNR